MQCPKCDSENVQRLSVVYSHGTRKVTASYTHHDDHHHHSQEIVQTVAAAMAAPPVKKKSIAACFFFFLSLVLMMLSAKRIVLLPISLAIIVWCIHQMKKSDKYNTEVYPKLFKKWSNSWMCNRCGVTYVQA